MSVMSGCEDCRQTSSTGGCAKHNSATYPSGVYEAAMLAHRHRWVYDGGAPSGVFVYHCDDHDPPVVRVVTNTSTGLP